MKAPPAPQLDERRAAAFSAELRARAHAWIPSWGIADGERDYGAALLDIAARFSSEVAERLDGSGEKMRRGFLDWLAVRGQAARPARMPVAFKLADAARESVLAQTPVRMQVDAAGTPVVFETEKDVRVIPGRLQIVVGVNAGDDAFYITPPGLSDLQPLEPLPVQWELKSFAAAGARKLQLDPESGLSADMILEVAGGQYKVLAADKGIVTIEPGLDADVSTPATVRKVTSFAPFGGTARNRQEHALYLGHMDLLNLEAAATIDVVGATTLVAGVSWQYWGKVDGSDEVAWQPLTLALIQDRSDAVILEKPKGAIEPRDIAGNSSRWIRAYATKASGTAPMLQVDALELRVNCKTNPAPCPPDAGAEASPAAEAMANTTPIVLDSVFFPLGKEPKQFDAFYLGSQEAFSKKAAKVQLCFEMADPTFSALSAVREGAFANAVLAGVAADRALHLFAFNSTTGGLDKFREREPLQPPLPGYLGQAETSPTMALDKQPEWRLPTWSQPDFGSPQMGFLVAASAGDSIWVWHEEAGDANKSGWVSLGPLPATNPPMTTPISGLVYLADAVAPQLVALREGQMWSRQWPSGQTWGHIDLLNTNGVAVQLESIVPVLVANATTSTAAGMVGIASDGTLFQVSSAGACTPVPPALSPRQFATDVRPVAINLNLAAGDLVVVGVEDAVPKALVAYRQTGLPPTQVTQVTQVALDAGMKVVANLEAGLINSVSPTDLYIFAAVKDGAAGRLITWAPYANGTAAARFDSALTSSGGQVGGAPTLLASHVVVPGNRADIFVSEFDPARRHVEPANVEIGVVVPTSLGLQINDLIVRKSGNLPEARVITQPGLPKDGESFFPINPPFPAGSTELNAYVLANTLSGTLLTADKLELAPTDHETVLGSWLYIDGELFTVDTLDTSVEPWQAKILSPTGGLLPTTADYVRPIATGGRIAPFIRMTPPANGNWDAALLDRLPLIFPTLAPPETQRGKAFSLGVGNQPGVVVLDSEFQAAVVNPIDFVLDDAVGTWSRLLGDTSVNPELSWEYWNGKGWWKLHVTLDETHNLKSKGALRFDVPSDIASSDWAGKTNFWIRARLIGGDYGREKVTVKSTVVGGVTEQTIERSSEGIRAPSVVKLSISYRVCDGVQPEFVLSEDSGSQRNQSEANRTAGATVEAFIPLALALGRLSSAVAPQGAKEDCPPDCGCQGAPSDATAAPTPATNATALATGRALLLGLTATPLGAPVNVFLLVDEEHDHGAFAPLVIEALVADRFIPIVAEDATRGLGESGGVSMSFTRKPTPRELFGQSLSWLRLAPAAGADNTNWKPGLRGAYLNTVWASATETLTRELLGSSEGAPNLALKLARPPVLHDTLELRVKEPLGEEERAELRRDGERQVLNDVDGLDGDWVLWKRVIDPLDARAGDRVYSLDEATGVIRFGDGLHGMIAPIGVDSIVAFSYKRTEPPKPGSDTVPGNLVTARTPLNLVSPVESVEAVLSVDQSAGGAPPENDDRVLRFGFGRVRHRDRAVTLRDIEDLALQSSPDIVQALSIRRRGYVRLVVVMRGKNPIPTAAQIRELRRLLLENAPGSLSAPNALRIGGPVIRRLRVELTLRVDALENAGALSDDVKERLYAHFDTAPGGPEQEGWQLGVSPREDDIALALIEAPHLASIVEVVLKESAPDGAARTWPSTLAPHELAMLDDDPIRVEFETAASKKLKVTP